MAYRPVIGLEIHAELKTKSKMFCSCLNNPDERPNVNVCPICLGHPGTLPVINEAAVRKVIKTGLALNCHIPESSKFDRKNYFYPDLPKGYQISQYDKPLCEKGYFHIAGKKINIRRVHLEEDTGKLVHTLQGDYSLVDFNRAGVPLMELVTDPDINSAKEARAFAQELQLILRYLGVSDADMEKGQMRVEANISLAEEKTPMMLGTKVEIKNLNSFRAVELGIDYEIKRQGAILDAGEKVLHETRGWNDSEGVTFSQREKEEAHDYRYFPEPDLPQLRNSQAFVEEIKAELPELPAQKRQRFQREYGLDVYGVDIFVSNRELGQYFEKVVSELDSGLSREDLLKLIKLTANYVISDLLGLLKDSLQPKKWLITPENFADFISLIHSGKISSKIAKMVLAEMFNTGADPKRIIEEKSLVQITDKAEIERVAKEIISHNPKAIEDFKSGNKNAIQFLAGKVMAATGGKANPESLLEILRRELDDLTRQR